MTSSAVPFVYVYNENGKFRFKREEGVDACQSHQLARNTSTITYKCAGCQRINMVLTRKCTTPACSFGLCAACQMANEGTRDDIHVKEKFPDTPHSWTRSMKTAAPRSLFSPNQTLEFTLLHSGKSKDLSERLTLFVNSRLGAKDNEVEHVSVRFNIDRAWVVLRSAEMLEKFIRSGNHESTIDLLDEWKVRWKKYIPPRARTVYQVKGITDLASAELLCTTVRSLIEEQLKTAPSEIDLVVFSEGRVLVVFSNGELDVSFTRSLFTSDGVELSLVPTSVSL